MQILLSPSKNMVAKPEFRPPFTTRPRFQREAERCALQMSELSVEELARTLQTNPQLAALNKQRYHDFLDPEPRAAAVLSYTGMTYRHLRPEAFSTAEMDYAQTHLYITSFLYGLTRPLDEIKNYRMEGNVVLPDHDGQTMFRFWRSRLTDLLLEAVGADDGGDGPGFDGQVEVVDDGAVAVGEPESDGCEGMVRGHWVSGGQFRRCRLERMRR